MKTKLLATMTKTVEKHVQHYKTDFYDYDVNTIKASEPGAKYVWIVRDCGTQLLDHYTVGNPNKYGYHTFEYYKETGAHYFLVDVDAGTITPIKDRDAYLTDRYSAWAAKIAAAKVVKIGSVEMYDFEAAEIYRTGGGVESFRTVYKVTKGPRGGYHGEPVYHSTDYVPITHRGSYCTIDAAKLAEYEQKARA